MFQTKLIALSRLMIGRRPPHWSTAIARPVIVGGIAINNARLKHHSSDRRDRMGGGKRKTTSFDTNPADDSGDGEATNSSDYDIFNDK